MTRREWAWGSPASDQLSWTTVFDDDRHGGWKVQESERTSHGWTRPNLRLIVGDPDQRPTGVVCYCLRPGADGYEVLLVVQERPAPGVRLWELPRGLAEATEPAALTANRELEEECGLHAATVQVVGLVYPDSGTLSSSVAVAVMFDLRATGTVADAETESAHWVAVTDLDTLVADGRLRDAISLAAIAVVNAWGACHMGRLGQ